MSLNRYKNNMMRQADIVLLTYKSFLQIWCINLLVFYFKFMKPKQNEPFNLTPKCHEDLKANWYIIYNDCYKGCADF